MRLRPDTPQVIVGSELVPFGQLSKTAFFNEFCLRHDMTQMLGTILFDGTEEDRMPFSNLCVYRPPGRADFETAEKNTLARLLPHFRRAVRIQRRVSALVNEQARNSLGTTQVASIVLDSQGAIQHANPIGQDFLLGLPAGCVRFGQLRGIGSRCSPMLRQALAACSASNPVRIAAYFAPPQARVVGATLLSLPPEYQSMPRPDARDRYLLLVDVPRVSGPKLAASVAGLFKLSPAEVRVLGELLDGKAPADIALEFGLSQATVRTQISSLLSKTGTRGQSELILLLRDIRQ